MTACLTSIHVQLLVTFIVAVAPVCDMLTLYPNVLSNAGTLGRRFTTRKISGDGRQEVAFTSLKCSSILSGNPQSKANKHTPGTEPLLWVSVNQWKLIDKERLCGLNASDTRVMARLVTHEFRPLPEDGPPECWSAPCDKNLCLAIETSCDDTCAAVVCESGEILSNVVKSQHCTTLENRGVNPKAASHEHCKQLWVVIAEALQLAGTDSLSIDTLAFTEGPGLLLCLKEGANAAKRFFTSMRSLLALCGDTVHNGTVEVPKRSIHEGCDFSRHSPEYCNALERQEYNASELDLLLEEAYDDFVCGLANCDEAFVEYTSPECTAVDVSWHLKNGFRSVFEKMFRRERPKHPKDSYLKMLERADLKNEIITTIRRRIWHRFWKGLSICGVNHLHGHALSVTLPGHIVRNIPSAKLDNSAVGGPSQRESIKAPFRVRTVNQQCVATSCSASMSSSTSSPRVTNSENSLLHWNPTSPGGPFLCLLVSGGHTLTSILTPDAEHVQCRDNSGIGISTYVKQTNFRTSRAIVGRKALGGSRTHLYSCYMPRTYESPYPQHDGNSEKSTSVFRQVPLPLQQFILGSTRDDAAGEVLDKAARELGQTEDRAVFGRKGMQKGWLVGGALIESLASEAGHDGTSHRSNFRVFAQEPRSLDFSFSGIKANFMRVLNAATSERKLALSKDTRCRLAAKIQQDVFGHICERLNCTLALCEFFPEIKSMALVGGVSRNRSLQAAVLRLLRRRLHESVQRREYEAMKCRLVKRVQSSPIEVHLDNSVSSWRAQEGGCGEAVEYNGSEVDSIKQHKCCVDEIRTILKQKVSEFSFEMYQCCSVSIVPFAEFCQNFDGAIRVGGTTSGTQNVSATEMKVAKRCGKCSTIFMPHGAATSVSFQKRRRGIRQLVVAHPQLCNDNAAMIAWAGFHYLRSHSNNGFERKGSHSDGPQLMPRFNRCQSLELDRVAWGDVAVDGDLSLTRSHCRSSLLKEMKSKSDVETNRSVSAFEPSVESTGDVFVKPKWAGGAPLHGAQDAIETLLLHSVLCL